MIQNIEPHVYRNEYVPEPPKEDSVILYYEGRKILVKLEDQEISFLTFKEAAVCYPDIYEDYTYLFSIDGQGYYLTDGIDPADFLSMGKATPFTGWEVQGRCLLTAAGETAVWYDADRLLKGE